MEMAKVWQKVYVILDNCSQDSFIYNNWLKELGIQSIKTILNLKTLHGERTESTIVVEGMQVTKTSGDGSLLTLPKLYAESEISVDK